jgi:opacity protein-like surface antigen
MAMSSGDTISRVVVTSDGYSNDVTVSGTGSIRLIDYGTIRARAGWANENILPYGFVGVAVGRADVMRSASVTIFGTDADPACVGPPDVCKPNFAFAQSQSEAKFRAIGYGWTVGGGIDWSPIPYIFVRGEYEFVGFPSFRDVRLNLHTVRAAVGVKF